MTLGLPPKQNTYYFQENSNKYTLDVSILRDKKEVLETACITQVIELTVSILK